ARDVKIISRIRELLYDEGFTVAGAKKRLEAEIAEGRFDDGLAPAPPLAVQKAAPAPMPAAAPPPPKVRPAAPTAPPAQPSLIEVASPRPTPAPASDFDRRAVLRELKDIVRLLDRARK